MIGKNGKVTLEKTTKSEIILFDSSSSIDDLKKILNKTTKIISFDYESHKILLEKNIEHEISDYYVSREMLVDVQNNCYRFSKWFEDNRFIQLIDYEGINLGLLIKVELNYFLVSFVKKFVEMERIFAKNTASNFFASPFLFDFIKLHTNLVTKINSGNSPQVFYYDTIKIPIRLGRYNFTIRLSKNQLDKITKIFDVIVTVLFGPKKTEKRKKSILMVEFDPIRYKKIFENLSMMQLNALLLNRRRPAVWNLESFSIIKNSGCYVLTTCLLDDQDVKISTQKNIELIHKKIETILKFDDFFESFFSINQLSFWNILKPKFIQLFTKRIDEIIHEIEMLKKIFEKYMPNAILVWSEIGSTEQIIVKLAKKFNVKIVLLQHGFFYDSMQEGAVNMNKFQGVYPIDADKYVAWGHIEEKHQIKNCTPNEKIVVLGSPLYDDIHNLKPKNELKNYILLATSGPVKENTLDLTVETIEKNRQTINEICVAVSKMNKKLVIKIHPSQDEFDPSQLAKDINPNIMVTKTANITELIKSCDVFVVIDASTVILDAHLLKKPVISVIVKDSDYGIPSVMSESCALTDMKNFEKILNQTLTDENFRKLLIEKGTKYVSEYVVNQGRASKSLLELLSNL